MAPNTESWTEKADGKSVGAILLMVIGGPLLAFGEGASVAVFQLTQIYAEAADAFSDGIGAYIRAFTADPAGAFSQVINQAANSFNGGPWEMLGPLQIPIFGGIIILTAWEFLMFLDSRGSDIPFTGVDIPLLLDNDSDGKED